MKYITITFAIILLVCTGSFIYLHEQTHQEIFRSWGINSSIEYAPENSKYFFATIGDSPCPSAQCISAQNNADVFAYHLLPFFLMIGCGLLLIIFLIEEILIKSEKNKEELTKESK